MQDNAAVGCQIRIQRPDPLKYLGTFCRQLVTSVLPHKSLLRTHAAVPSIYVWNGGQAWFGGSIAPAAAPHQLTRPEHVPGTPSLEGHGLVPGRDALGVVQVPADPVVRRDGGRPLRRRRRRVSQGRWRRWQRFVLFPHHTGRRLNNTGSDKKGKLHRGMNVARDQVWLYRFSLRYFLGTLTVLQPAG